MATSQTLTETTMRSRWDRLNAAQKMTCVRAGTEETLQICEKGLPPRPVAASEPCAEIAKWWKERLLPRLLQADEYYCKPPNLIPGLIDQTKRYECWMIFGTAGFSPAILLEGKNTQAMHSFADELRRDQLIKSYGYHIVVAPSWIVSAASRRDTRMPNTEDSTSTRTFHASPEPLETNAPPEWSEGVSTPTEVAPRWTGSAASPYDTRRPSFGDFINAPIFHALPGPYEVFSKAGLTSRAYTSRNPPLSTPPDRTAAGAYLPAHEFSDSHHPYSRAPTMSHPGRQAQFRFVDLHKKLCTTEAVLGGLVQIDGNLFATTVAHALLLPATSDGKDADARILVATTAKLFLDNGDMTTFKRSDAVGGVTIGLENDWALVPMASKSSLITRNVFQFGSRTISIDKIGDPSEGMDLLIVGHSSSSHRRVRCSLLPSLISIPTSNLMHRAYSVRGTKFEVGDSGSWIVDARSGTLVGILVMRSVHRRHGASMLSAVDVFTDIAKANSTDADKLLLVSGGGFSTTLALPTAQIPTAQNLSKDFLQHDLTLPESTMFSLPDGHREFAEIKVNDWQGRAAFLMESPRIRLNDKQHHLYLKEAIRLMRANLATRTAQCIESLAILETIKTIKDDNIAYYAVIKCGDPKSKSGQEYLYHKEKIKKIVQSKAGGDVEDSSDDDAAGLQSMNRLNLGQGGGLTGKPGDFTIRGFTPTNNGAASKLKFDTKVPEGQRLDKQFTKKPSNYFSEGTMFAVLWPEPAGEGSNPHAAPVGDRLTKGFVQSLYQQWAWVEVRRMIVIRNRPGYCWCVMVATYGGKGVGGQKFSEEELQSHAIVYDAKKKPEYLKDEPELDKSPIAVVMAANQTLSTASRVHTGQPQRVRHKVKVMEVGKLTKEAFGLLNNYVFEELEEPSRRKRPGSTKGKGKKRDEDQ